MDPVLSKGDCSNKNKFERFIRPKGQTSFEIKAQLVVTKMMNNIVKSSFVHLLVCSILKLYSWKCLCWVTVKSSISSELGELPMSEYQKKLNVKRWREDLKSTSSIIYCSSPYQGLCLRLRSHGVAQMERWHMETYPANGKSRLSSPLRLAFPTSKQESRLLQGKISNSHRFRFLLGFLIAWEGLSCLSTACWPAHSGFNWRSWAQIGEVGNCLRPTYKSYHAPGSLAPKMNWIKSQAIWSNVKYHYCNGRWNFKVVWQLLSMLDPCTLLTSSWRSPFLIVLFVLGWRRFFESSWEHVIGQLPSTAFLIIIGLLQFYCMRWQISMQIEHICHAYPVPTGLLCWTKSSIGQVRGICSHTWQGGFIFHNCFPSKALNFAFDMECWHLMLIPCLQLPSVQSGSREGGGSGGGGW